jgi:arylsulfatase A-like enzyme
MPQPNLLFIFTDEQRYDTFAAYGNTRIQMPNLNRLAAQSVVFDRAYVTQPVCTPSRSTLLTGLWPHTNGCTENNISLRAGIPCFPEMLRAGEYITAYHGKWHLGDEIFQQHGFDDWVSVDDTYNEYYSPERDREIRSTYHHWLLKQGLKPKNGRYFGRMETARLPERYSKPAYQALEASRFIRENAKRPFALFINFFEPHMPFFGPRDNQYDPADVTLPANFDALPGPDQPLKTRLFQRAYYDHGHGLPLKTEADWRRMIANYWGLCSLVDTHVGTILNTLEECDLTDNTLIVYTSDHGDMMGSHRLIAKCVMFEEAARVPLLVHLPGQTSARHIAAPTSQIDVVPTLLELMGQPLPGQLQGKSQRAALEGRTAPAKNVFIEWNGHNNGLGDVIGQVIIPDYMSLEGTSREEAIRATLDPVRTVVTPDGWKFNCSPMGEHELYDLNKDPGETINLATRADMRPLMHKLQQEIREWQARTSDTTELPPI